MDSLQSFNKYFPSIHYMLDPILSAGDTTMNKRDSDFCLYESYTIVGKDAEQEKDNEQINKQNKYLSISESIMEKTEVWKEENVFWNHVGIAMVHRC